MTQPAPTQQLSLIRTMANRYGLEPAKFKTTLVKTVFPSDKQNVADEQVAAFLVVANQYNLNPFIKEIYAFPGKGGGIVPIVSIDGWNTIINRQPQYDGVEFTDELDKDDNIVAITAKIYRKDRSHPIMVTEYMKECARNTEPWKQFPTRMLRHKALIQAARYAFGLAGIFDPDEAERIVASTAGDAPPVPVAVISEEQRTALVKLAQDNGVIERLGEIVNGAGFDMLAHITVDAYADVEKAIRAAKPADESGVVDGEFVDVETSETEPQPIDKAASKKSEWMTLINDKLAEISGGDPSKIVELTGGQDLTKLTIGQLKDLFLELEKKQG